jgi:mono/diheme cytochrome c family protein
MDGSRLALAALAASGLLGAGAAAEAASPRVLYALQCRGCHLDDGSGTPGRIPALAGSVSRFAATPAGRAYLVRVPGVAQAALSDAEVAELLNWLLPAFDADHLPPDFRAYTAEEVGPLRRRPLVDVDAARSEILDTLAAGGARPERGPQALR